MVFKECAVQGTKKGKKDYNMKGKRFLSRMLCMQHEYTNQLTVIGWFLNMCIDALTYYVLGGPLSEINNGT